MVIDERNPFVLFAIELETDFNSRFITKNTFEKFEALQRRLVSLDNQLVYSKSAHGSIETYRLKHVLPRFPSTFLGLFFRKSVPNAEDLEVSKEFTIN